MSEPQSEPQRPSHSAEGYRAHPVKVGDFEGPLDLLLHLVRAHEVDITDIPIVTITEQYNEYLEMMRELNLDIAGEYLVMAATLMHIKSRMLLPPDPVEEGEEAEDPRADLAQQLLEYQRIKQAAENLPRNSAGQFFGFSRAAILYFHAGEFKVGGQNVYVSRTGWTNERGDELYTRIGETDHEKLFDDVMAAGEPHGLKFGSLASMEIRRIEGGIHDNITDFDMTMTPFAAGLGHLVDLDKEYFIGRDALLKVEDRRPRLLGLVCQEDTPASSGWVAAITLNM